MQIADVAYALKGISNKAEGSLQPKAAASRITAITSSLDFQSKSADRDPARPGRVERYLWEEGSGGGGYPPPQPQAPGSKN